MAKRWTLEDIPWDKFDVSKVDPETLAIVKAASMVEHNGYDYGAYLGRVFGDDDDFRTAVEAWGTEEVQHGTALRRWAELADPTFDFDKAFADFRRAYHADDGFGLMAGTSESNRGSRSRELIYRCIVEAGTSSFYSAMSDSTDEPVLKEVCRNIAADEFRHYSLFYNSLKRYREIDGIGAVRRFTSALRCVTEYQDDIVAYAYFAANDVDGPYDRKAFGQAYERRAAQLYRPSHASSVTKLFFRAAGLNHRGRLVGPAGRLLFKIVQARTKRLGRKAERRAKSTDSQDRALAF